MSEDEDDLFCTVYFQEVWLEKDKWIFMSLIPQNLTVTSLKRK
jgi:hypothetical protein